jgi:hypothetical protein
VLERLSSRDNRGWKAAPTVIPKSLVIKVDGFVTSQHCNGFTF